MFKPDFSAMSSFSGFINVLKTAAGQMFFSLSLGMGCMITYGSYLDKKEDLQKNAIIIPACDTLIAVMAGMAVLPACAAYDVPYASGPGLLFTSMQQVFTNMGEFGAFVGFMFYFLVFIAAVTSSISLLEVVCTYRIDAAIDKGKKPNRQKITCIAAGLIFVVGLPVALDALGSGGAAFPAPYEIINYQVAEGGKIPMAIDCWLDFFDMLSEGVLMPFGALAMSVLIGWVYKTKNAVVPECEQSGHKFWGYGFFNVCFKFIVPVIMAFVLYGQISDFF